VANNPASLAFSEVVQMHTQRPRLLISIGTCLPQQKKREKHSTFQISYIKNKVDTLSQLTKLLTQSEKTHRNLNLIVNQLEAPNKMEYSRFNAVTGAKEIDLDEWKTSNGSNQTLSQLRALTVDYLKQAGTHKELLKCARLLIMIRRQRASTVRWESYATNHLYYCPERKCTNIARALKTRESLRDHAYDAHGFIYDTLAYYGDKVHHACIWDQCEHGGVHLFGTRDAYLMHLEDVHNINKKAVFRDRQELERWLDRGRKRPEEALNFVKNYKERAKTMGHSPNHTGDGEVQNDRAELSRASEVEAR
jgi:hypothetical protein